MEIENELKVRLKTEETLTGVCTDKAWDNSDFLSFTQVNPSYVANLVEHRTSLKLGLAEVGEEIAYRPSPSQVRSDSKRILRK